jgi:hypothetical protein
MVYVISNFKGYLCIDHDDNVHWIRSPFSADKFESEMGAKKTAALVGGIVVII